jgi:hypothetical protein
MARNEADREDLMREAVALTERVELSVPGFEELITIGFRSNGAMSIFVGQDPVYQFDPSGRLRRAFVDGFLFRSQHSGLARLERVRTESEVQLLRYDLPPARVFCFSAGHERHVESHLVATSGEDRSSRALCT